MNRLLKFPLIWCMFLSMHGNVSHAQDTILLDSLQNLLTTQTDGPAKVETLGMLFDQLIYQDPEQAVEYARAEVSLAKSLDFGEGLANGNYHIGVYFNNRDEADSAHVYYQRAFEVYGKLGDLDGQGNVNHAEAILAYAAGNYEEAIALIQRNVEIYSQLPHSEMDLAQCHDLLGFIHLYLGNYQLALRETLKGLKIFEQGDDRIRYADALNHMGGVEFCLKHYESSIEHNLAALEIYRSEDDRLYTAQVLNDLGNTAYHQADYPQAESYLTDGLALAREMASATLIGTALGNLGKTYTRQGKFPLAIQSLKESVAIHESTGAMPKVVESLNDLGDAYTAMGQPVKAIPIFDRSLKLASEMDVQEGIMYGFERRSQAHAALGEYRAAWEDQRQFKQFSDSLFNETQSRQIEEMRTIYQTEKKEQENEILRQEAQLDGLKIRNLWISLLLLTSLAVIGFLAYRFRAAKREWALQQEKLALSKELDFKQRELTTHALHLVSKNELLNQLKTSIESLKSETDKPAPLRRLIGIIDQDLRKETDWEQFESYFQAVHDGFADQIKLVFEELTVREFRLLTLMRMKLSTKEIASMLNITPDSVNKARYRIRKKLKESTDLTLQEYIQKF
ncbi:tetratricopeptide repeat protein [Pontibacter sp. G13]|uniref:tetratricopeptide repeat protein n=1 Tax=Pontibacter sp. G13 TaxID=3074898 RepID=UPI00288C2E9F|nr:tetratricopeptide repeat protein [Pontibacter sp. G13]WNJ19031.1 tetratricopeptide repeat protein [Pontibacter sp. G13]